MQVKYFGKAIIQLQDEIKSNITGEVVNTLTNNLNQIPNKLSQINDGVDKLYEGSNTLATGTSSLASGANNLNKNYLEFNNGISTLKLAMSSLNDGNKRINDGISTVLSGSKKLEDGTKDLYKINDGAKNLEKGSNELLLRTEKYISGVNKMIGINDEIGNKLKAYILENPSALLDPNIAYIVQVLNNPEIIQSSNLLQVAGTNIKTNMKAISSGIENISKSTGSLSNINSGIISLSKGLEAIKEGSNNAIKGGEKINNGLINISNSSNKISSGISTLSLGTNKLDSGVNDLKAGLEQASTKINEGIETSKEELKSTNGLSEFVTNSVNINQENVNPVPNYGTAFAPYFMSLSVWVGGLIIFVVIYLDADKRFKILSRESNKKVLRTFIFILLGIVQSLLLAFVLRKGLNLTTQNLVLYYFACILVSMVFISIIQFFIVHFKDAGKFIVILLLILQLTSCGGTFPMELVPEFFNKLYNFMPMTYSVNLFKAAISGADSSFIFNNILILSSIMVVSVGFTIGLSLIKRNKLAN